jgi:hypothetical protein
MTAPPAGYSRKTAAVAAPPPGYSKRTSLLDMHIPPNPIFNAPGTIRDLPRTADDVMRVAADSMTRGLLDKGLGEEDQAKTQASRERLGWSALPVDVGASIIASPYRIGSMGIGALAGAGEGALSAYGHQKDWIPDAQGAWDILKGAGYGAVAGGAGAGVGKKIGERQATSIAEDARPYQTQADIDAAVTQGRTADEAAYDAGTSDIMHTPQTEDLAKRAAASRAAESAQGSTRDDLARMLAGMDLPPEVEAKVAGITGKKGLVSGAGKVVDQLPGKELNIPALAIETAIGHGVPWKTLGGVALKAGVSTAGKSDWANQVPDKSIEELARLARNGVLNLDPAIVDKGRDTLSKMMIGTARRP